MNKISKAIFPVAGFGTRVLPATKAMPKELQPILDKPLIQYAVEEAIAASADVESSTETETTVKSMLGKALEREGEREYERGLWLLVEGGGDEVDFENLVAWDVIELRVDRITEGLKSSDYAERAQCAAEIISVGIDPRLIMSAELLDKRTVF